MSKNYKESGSPVFSEDILKLKQEKRGITVVENDTQQIHVNLGNDVRAIISGSDPWDLTHAGEVSKIRLQNGGDMISVVEALHKPGGTYDLFLLGEDDFLQIHDVTQASNLALELAYALAYALRPYDRFLKRQEHKHVDNRIVNHIIGAKDRAKNH